MIGLRDAGRRLLPALAFIGLGGVLPPVPEPRYKSGGKSAKAYARWKSRNRMARAARRANRAG